MADIDRESIGLTAETQALLEAIEQNNWFTEGQDIARFCMAYAIRAGVKEGVTSGTETRWAAGNFDKKGDIRSLISALYPDCSTPVRQMEYLVNEGLKLIAPKISLGLGPAHLFD